MLGVIFGTSNSDHKKDNYDINKAAEHIATPKENPKK